MSRCWTFFSFVLSIHRSQQPRRGRPSKYSGCSFCKAWIIDPEMLPTPRLNFTGVNTKSAKFALFLTSLGFELRVWKCSKISEFWNKLVKQRWSPYVLPILVKLGSRIHENRFPEMPHPATPKIGRQQKCTISPITQLRIFRFRSNLYRVYNRTLEML